MKTAAVRAMVTSSLLLGVVALSVGASIAAAQVVVDTCGQQLADDGILMADLDCTAAPDPVIHFTASGTLFLNGFTLSGSAAGSVRRIDVVGPGTITGPGVGVSAGGTFLHGGQVTVTDADISGNAGDGVVATGNGGRAHARVRDSTVSNNGGFGVSVSTTSTCPFLNCAPQEKVTIERSTISGNGTAGVYGSTIKIKDSTMTFNAGSGVQVKTNDANRKLRISHSTMDDNGGAGVRLQNWRNLRVAISDSSLSRNGIGLQDGSGFRTNIKLKRCTIDFNGIGIVGGAAGPEDRTKLTLKDTDVLGNARSGIRTNGDSITVTILVSRIFGSATDASCGVTEACADLETSLLPNISLRSACDTSLISGSGIPGTTWEICAND